MLCREGPTRSPPTHGERSRRAERSMMVFPQRLPGRRTAPSPAGPVDLADIGCVMDFRVVLRILGHFTRCKVCLAFAPLSRARCA